jgi:hypothetical protein
MDFRADLIAQILAYCASHDISTQTFGVRAVNDWKFFGRLESGQSVSLRNMERVVAFMRDASTANSEAA